MEAFQAHRKWLQKLIITLEATLNLKKKKSVSYRPYCMIITQVKFKINNKNVSGRHALGNFKTHF